MFFNPCLLCNGLLGGRILRGSTILLRKCRGKSSYSKVPETLPSARPGKFPPPQRAPTVSKSCSEIAPKLSKREYSAKCSENGRRGIFGVTPGRRVLRSVKNARNMLENARGGIFGVIPWAPGAKFGKHRPDVDEIWPKSVQCWPDSAKHGPTRAKFGRILTKFGRRWGPAPIDHSKDASEGGMFRALFEHVSSAPSGGEELGEHVPRVCSRRPPHGAATHVFSTICHSCGIASPARQAATHFALSNSQGQKMGVFVQRAITGHTLKAHTFRCGPNLVNFWPS